MSAPARAPWAIQQATQVANQAKVAIRLSAVSEEKASANSTVGTVTATAAAMVRSGRSHVAAATDRLGLTSTPTSQSATAGRSVITHTMAAKTPNFPRM